MININPLQSVGLSLIDIIAVITKEYANGTMITYYVSLAYGH